uniref:Uncharacterized protein n=1 Tax=Tanacetum cinerariifolium TaxID=118510 RepID=A0A699T8A3_TANCI|nr:hypothetical protein [Tanacetum cinerariifolium]
MVVVDGSIDWDKQTEEGNTEPRSLENFGMVAGLEIASDAESEGEITKDKEQLNDCVVDLKAHKHVVKSLEKQIKCHQMNQLAY